MSSILIPVIIVAAIGLIAGLGLAIASVALAVPVDEKEQAIADILPGANCGSCGFSGCSGYAAALAKGEASSTTLCSPGGAGVASQIAEILGVEAGEMVKKSAVVKCLGNNDNTSSKYNYIGEKTCYAASQLGGGPQSCLYGCIGFGDCMSVCEYGAVNVCNGVAAVDMTKCAACGKCVKACPKGLIEIVPVPKDGNLTAVLCSNRDKGAETRKVCKTGCLGCMRCVKTCETGAISVSNNIAKVDYEKCTHCGKCIEVCAPKCLNVI